MRSAFFTAPLLLPLFFFLFSFFNGSSVLGTSTTAVVSTPPSVALASPPSSFHPADIVEEACHLMTAVWAGSWYPHCVTAFRSNPESRNATTLPKLAVLAAEIVLRDVSVELKQMQVMKSRGTGGDPEQLERCLSGFDFFIPRLQAGLEDLQKDGRVGFEFLFVDILGYVDCRWMKSNPVKKQMEILVLIQAISGICHKYCKYPAPKPCRFW